MLDSGICCFLTLSFVIFFGLFVVVILRQTENLFIIAINIPYICSLYVSPRRKIDKYIFLLRYHPEEKIIICHDVQHTGGLEEPTTYKNGNRKKKKKLNLVHQGWWRGVYINTIYINDYV
jgi:hypothetical protein